MSTTKNPQMTKVIVNVSRDRIATENDIAKHDIIQALNKLFDDKFHEEKVEINSEYLRHMEKHIQAITAKLGAPELREAYLPTQKFVFAE